MNLTSLMQATFAPVAAIRLLTTRVDALGRRVRSKAAPPAQLAVAGDPTPATGAQAAGGGKPGRAKGKPRRTAGAAS